MDMAPYNSMRSHRAEMMRTTFGMHNDQIVADPFEKVTHNSWWTINGFYFGYGDLSRLNIRTIRTLMDRDATFITYAETDGDDRDKRKPRIIIMGSHVFMESRV